MQCSANHPPRQPGRHGDLLRALASTRRSFFGLFGHRQGRRSRPTPTGADRDDDEHGWSDRGTFNFGGRLLRPRRSNLSPEAEPEIYATTRMFGTVIENMVYDPQSLELDFDDDQPDAQHAACAYPMEYISNASRTALGGHAPRTSSCRLCDRLRRAAADFRPRLDPAQAMYQLPSTGFTSKVRGHGAGGVTEPAARPFLDPASAPRSCRFRPGGLRRDA